MLTPPKPKFGSLLPKAAPVSESTGTFRTHPFSGYLPAIQHSPAEIARQRELLHSSQNQDAKDVLTVAGAMAGGLPGVALNTVNFGLDVKDAIKGGDIESTDSAQAMWAAIAAAGGNTKWGKAGKAAMVLGDYMELTHQKDPSKIKPYGPPRSHTKGGLLPTKLTMLGPDGKPQMELGGGNRIFSRANTRELVTRSQSAKTPAELKELGGRIRAMLDQQDRNKPEYVKD